MDCEPRDVVRTIREALGLSKTAFARALGWAPSTIARWESGRARPGRLALKIILAFGEERGVRYRPARAQLPVPASSPAPIRGTPSRPALPVREAEQVYARAVPDNRPGVTTTERPRWQAEVSFRVAVDRSRSWPSGSRSWLRPAPVAAALCAALLLGVTFLTRAPRGDDPTTPPGNGWAARPAWAGARAAADEPDPDELAATDSTPADDDSAVAAAPDPSPQAEPSDPEPRAATARLEGVTLVGPVRMATFRTDEDSLTIAEGEQLGERQAVRIAVSGVELSDATGRIETVRLGEMVPID